MENFNISKLFSKKTLRYFQLGIGFSWVLSFIVGFVVYNYTCYKLQVSSDDFLYHAFMACGEHRFKIALYCPVLIIGIYLSVVGFIWNFLKQSKSVIVVAFLGANLFLFWSLIVHLLFLFIPTIADPMAFWGSPFAFMSKFDSMHVISFMSIEDIISIMTNEMRVLAFVILATSFSFAVPLMDIIQNGKNSNRSSYIVSILSTMIAVLGSFWLHYVSDFVPIVLVTISVSTMYWILVVFREKRISRELAVLFAVFLSLISAFLMVALVIIGIRVLIYGGIEWF